MSFDFIKPDELATTFRDATKFAAPLHEPFDEYERIARNRPHPGIAKELPKVTDGTLASIIQDKPKRIIQQIPTGRVHTTDRWLEIMADYILREIILPNANEEAAFIQKCWAAISKAMIYGSQPGFVKFLQRGDYFGTDIVLPYVKDVLLEPGKISDRASNVIFMRSWWSKTQIRALIDSQKDLKSKAEDRGDTFETGWDLGKLADLLEEGTSQKDATAQNSFEKNKMLNAGYYELVHVFQRGIEGTFYTFSPKMEDGDNVLRTKTNPDPRGVIPIHYIYADQDMSNPLGRGAVEMSGGMQNLLDSETQMYQLNRALGLNPPMKKWGTWSKANAKFVPNHIIELGAKTAGNDIEPFPIDTTALNNFPQNVQLMQSQIMRLNQSGDTASISADAGAIGMSKTPEGIKTRDAQLSISDNHTRKQFESWFEDITETAINLYFAERHGVQELNVDVETADKLSGLDPSFVGPNNAVRIDYDTETEKLTFRVDPTSSNVKDDQEQSQMLTEILQQVSQDPLISYRMSQDGYKLNMGEAYKELYSLLGIKNINKIITPMSDQEKQQAQQAPMPMMDKPKLSVAYDDLADNPQAQQGVLANAGVELPIEVFQQAAQVKQQMEAQKNAPAPTGPEEHPLIKLMTTLNIKFTDLDQTAQMAVLQALGLPSDGNTPSVQQMQLDAQGQAHQQQIDQAKTHLEAVNTAAKAAQVLNSHNQTHADNALKAAQFQQSSTQADRQHELAVQASQSNQGATK